MIFTAWIDSPLPRHVSICLDTFREQFGDQCQIVTDDTLAEYVDATAALHPAWRSLPHIAWRADCLRAALLATRGGWWVDADSVITAPSAMWAAMAGDADVACARWPAGTPGAGRILNGAIYCRAGSLFAAAWLAGVNAELARHAADPAHPPPGGHRWTHLGEAILTPLVDSGAFDVRSFDPDRIAPITSAQILAPGDLAALLKPDTLCITLYQSHVTAHYPQWAAVPEDAPSLFGASLRHGMRATAFADIYRTDGWRGGESRSGPGSTLVEAAQMVKLLPAVLRFLGVRSLLDAPCGDLNWMQHAKLGKVNYIGADVVPAIVEANSARFPKRAFVVADIVTDPLPAADAVLCRDCLVHLPLADAAAAVANIRRSGAMWLLATTFPAVETNGEIVTGGHRALNMQRAPFNLGLPERLLDEAPSGKKLGVWRINGPRRVVLTGTSYRGRDGTVQPTIDSLFNQDYDGDYEVRLYLQPGCEHPPSHPRLRVIPCPELGPICKLTAATDDTLSPNTILISYDDDIIYHRPWLSAMVADAEAHPDEAVGADGWKHDTLCASPNGPYNFPREPGLVDVLQGCAGVAYRRRFFDHDILDNKFFNDDVHIHSYLYRRGILRRKTRPTSMAYITADFERDGLCKDLRFHKNNRESCIVGFGLRPLSLSLSTQATQHPPPEPPVRQSPFPKHAVRHKPLRR